jgi:hypothetical protein
MHACTHTRTLSSRTISSSSCSRSLCASSSSSASALPLLRGVFAKWGVAILLPSLLRSCQFCHCSRSSPPGEFCVSHGSANVDRPRCVCVCACLCVCMGPVGRGCPSDSITVTCLQASRLVLPHDVCLPVQSFPGLYMYIYMHTHIITLQVVGFAAALRTGDQRCLASLCLSMHNT